MWMSHHVIKRGESPLWHPLRMLTGFCFELKARNAPCSGVSTMVVDTGGGIVSLLIGWKLVWTRGSSPSWGLHLHPSSTRIFIWGGSMVAGFYTQCGGCRVAWEQLWQSSKTRECNKSYVVSAADKKAWADNTGRVNNRWIRFFGVNIGDGCVHWRL